MFDFLYTYIATSSLEDKDLHCSLLAFPIVSKEWVGGIDPIKYFLDNWNLFYIYEAPCQLEPDKNMVFELYECSGHFIFHSLADLFKQHHLNFTTTT